MSNLRVLIVDDDTSTRKVLRRWLTRALDVDVSEAADGLEAFEQITEQAADLVITDIHMPLLNGLELVSLVRDDPELADTEIIAMSVDSSQTLVTELVKMGVLDFIVKPLLEDQVIHRLEGVIRTLTEKRAKRNNSSTLPKVLVADRDANFREFARTALKGLFHCEVAKNAGELLVGSIRHKPPLILVSPALPGFRLEFLLKKLRLGDSHAPTHVYLLTSDAGDQPDGLQRVSGTVMRTFVPAAFRAEVCGVMNGVLPRKLDGSPFSMLRQEMPGAIRLVLGTLTGTDPHEKPEPEDEPLFGIFGAISLNSTSDDLRIEANIAAEETMIREFARVMLDLPEEEVDTEIAESTLQEILNMYGGRIKSLCDQKRIDLTLHLPEIGRAESAVTDEATLDVKWYFEWGEGHLFKIRLRVFAASS
ncbi:MAG: response regulator [Acidobacteria bacterium]|nr:response regulator [Acidobacteriota bacterium]